MRITQSLIILAAMVVAGCATIQGSVAPMEGGQYKAVSIAGNKYTAHKIADNDASVTCKREKRSGYVVLSQDVNEEKPPEMESGNQFVDTALGVAAFAYHEKHKEVELTTIFKCKG
jgi:hypothetical protein